MTLRCDQLMDTKRRCTHTATERFVWPSKKDWIHVCHAHGAWARKIAATMGVALVFEEIPELGTPSPDDSCPVCGTLRGVVGFCGVCDDHTYTLGPNEDPENERADTAEAEVLRLREAVGLATTCAPQMEIDPDHPIEMRERDEARAEVARLRDIISPGDAAAYEHGMAALQAKLALLKGLILVWQRREDKSEKRVEKLERAQKGCEEHALAADARADTAEAEVARLEGLIRVWYESPNNNPSCNALVAEARRIRKVKP